MSRKKTDRKMPAVMRETVEEKVFKIIRREILEGRLKGGQRLVQDELAKDLGTSRIPVRSALKLLEASGLVAQDVRGFYSVSNFTANDIREIYDLRALIEPHAALLALQHLTPDDIGDLKELNREMARSIDAGDADHWADLNTEFHLLIYEASRQPRLVRIIRDLWFGRPMFSPIKSREQTKKSTNEHKEIVRAVEARDATAVDELVRNHIRAAGAAWSDYLATRDREE